MAKDGNVESVDRTLQAREQTIQLLKFNLKKAQDRMKSQVDKKGLKESLRKVAYKLQLPSYAMVHPVFHESQLKACYSEVKELGQFPRYDSEGLLVKQGNRAVVFGLIQWSNGTEDDATWELLSDIVKGQNAISSNCLTFSLFPFGQNPIFASNNPQQSGCGPPPKPWEQAGTSSGPAPFKPSSPGSTSDVVEASGTARPGEMVPANDASAVNTNALGRPVPARPWMQQNTYGSTYGAAGYGGGLNYNSGYGTGTYGSYGGLGATGSYNTGLYGSNMYGGGGGYGGLYGSGGGMYGGAGMYNNSYGGMMGGYGMGMGGGPGGPYGDQDPNNPFGAAPSSPPGFWISLMHVMHGVVTFFGRVAMLIDQNTQAFHMFMSALLQLFDRSGMLYGELARFVFRLLGVKTKLNKIHFPGPNGPQGPQNYNEPPKAAPAAGSWDRVWGNNTNN